MKRKLWSTSACLLNRETTSEHELRNWKILKLQAYYTGKQLLNSSTLLGSDMWTKTEKSYSRLFMSTSFFILRTLPPYLSHFSHFLPTHVFISFPNVMVEITRGIGRKRETKSQTLYSDDVHHTGISNVRNIIFIKVQIYRFCLYSYVQLINE